MASTRLMMAPEVSGLVSSGTNGFPGTSVGHREPTYLDENMPPDVSSAHEMIFNPPATVASGGRSPLKAAHKGSSSPPKAELSESVEHVMFPPPKPLTYTDSPHKNSNASMQAPAPAPPTQPFLSLYPSWLINNPSSTEKDHKASVYHSDNLAEFPDPSPGCKTTRKRALSNAGSNQESRSKKTRTEEGLPQTLPQPESMPTVEDDGRKPPFSYAVLIGMAILRAPDRRLTLAQIYRWISETFSHYRNKAEPGWQNSIRHNLSLNKAFYKQERPKDDPGKGNYWAIEPGKESMFLNKDKSTSRRPASNVRISTKNSSQPPSSESGIWIVQQPPFVKETPPIVVDAAAEPSSDATVPASDAPSSVDGEDDVFGGTAQPAGIQAASSPPQDITSSPPVLAHTNLRDDTPSPGLDLDFTKNSVRSRTRKMCLPEMEDSGYFSSLGSSATRPSSNPVLPLLDHSKSRIKRGRAEEEIARIRSSSREISPTKARSYHRLSSSLPSSSPTHQLDAMAMLPPLTPAYKFKLPPKPPPSISPNTNLRNHRNNIKALVGSPLKNVGAHDDFSYSPAFKILDDDHFALTGNSSPAFTIFDDNADSIREQALGAPPNQHSARRNGMDRVSRTSDILADVTGTSLNSRSTASLLGVPNIESPLKQKSKSKSPLRNSNHNDENINDDLLNIDFLDNEDSEDFGGLDILQGFEKIGENRSANTFAKKVNRPALGNRSRTSLF